MKTVAKFLGLLIAACAAYLLFWPVPITPQAWEAPPAVPLTGVHAVNDRLSEFQAIDLEGLHGAEAVIDDGQGMAYSATKEGWIIRWEAEAANPKIERWVDVGGRPLGIAFDDAGNLWIANALIGLQKLTSEGVLTTELDQVANTPIVYADDLDVTSDGFVYLSDASTKFSAKEFSGTLEASLLDINEHGGHGRIIEYNIGSGEAKVIMQDLDFANGVALSAVEDFFLVTETGSYRVWKYWRTGDKSGQAEVIVPNLPGFPDNVHLGQEGRFWVGLASPRAKPLDDFSGNPFVRKMIQRLPEAIRPNVVAYGHALIIDENGNILASLQDPNERIAASTGAWETDNYVYVSSLTMPILARYTKAQLGLQ